MSLDMRCQPVKKANEAREPRTAVIPQKASGECSRPLVKFIPNKEAPSPPVAIANVPIESFNSKSNKLFLCEINPIFTISSVDSIF